MVLTLGLSGLWVSFKTSIRFPAREIDWRKFAETAWHVRSFTVDQCNRKWLTCPPERCTPDQPPFTNTGLDMFGPFYVRVGRSQAKRYGVIFTCFSTRAIHLEVLHTMEADSFINALLRFAARRGFPNKVWSDNGTNIVGARSEMSRSMKQLDRSKIIRAARQKDVEWVFNPPYASHHGGVWERHIRTVRQVMVAVLGLSPCLTTKFWWRHFVKLRIWSTVARSQSVMKTSMIQLL